MFTLTINTRLRHEQMKFGRHLRYRRIQSGFASYKSLSIDSGMPARQIEKIEQARSLLTLGKLIQLSEVFNVPVAALFDYHHTLTVAELREGFFEGDEKMLSKEIGERLFLQREKRGITYLDLQLETNFDKTTICEYEEGERVFDFRTLIIFVEILQIELFHLFAD